jgi:hypothetical protein
MTQIVGLVGWDSSFVIFFYLLFIILSRSYDLSHEFVMLT